VRLPKLKLRKNKAFNAFQIVNVGAAYVLAPLRLWPEVLFLQGVSYVVVGVTFCLLHPPGVSDDDASGAPTPVAP